MNRIGIAILFLAILLGSSCKSQNFYWSHTYVESGVENVEYGLLYNWYAVNDVREITPSGWVVPSATDYQTLITYLGGTTVAGGKAKEVGYDYWASPNTDATNEVGFNGRGSGRRKNTGIIEQITVVHDQWTTGETSTLGRHFSCLFNSPNFNDNGYFSKAYGISVRLLKQTTTLSHGETSTMIGNDGKVYRTICIGTQEWLADNLCETRFRNGDIIPWYGASQPSYFTDAEWAALVTAGVCAYSDNETNVSTGFSFPTE